MVFYAGQNRKTEFYQLSEIGREDGQSEVTVRSPRFDTFRMKYAEDGGINWTWFKVQNGNLVAVFRLHYGEEPLLAFRKLQKKMAKVDDIKKVPWATWREPCDLVTSHTAKKVAIPYLK